MTFTIIRVLQAVKNGKIILLENGVDIIIYQVCYYFSGGTSTLSSRLEMAYVYQVTKVSYNRGRNCIIPDDDFSPYTCAASFAHAWGCRAQIRRKVAVRDDPVMASTRLQYLLSSSLFCLSNQKKKNQLHSSMVSAFSALHCKL
jgi:hypothetical protein